MGLPLASYANFDFRPPGSVIWSKRPFVSRASNVVVPSGVITLASRPSAPYVIRVVRGPALTLVGRPEVSYVVVASTSATGDVPLMRAATTRLLAGSSVNTSPRPSGEDVSIVFVAAR